MTEDIRSKILATLETIKKYEKEDEEKIVKALISQGISELEAEVLIAFVPLAFGRVFLLEKLQEKIQLSVSENISIFHEKSGAYFSLPLRDEPVYVEAYKIAKETSSTSQTSMEQIMPVVFYGAEASTIGNALHSGATLESLDGGEIDSPVLMNLGQIDGFESRYQQFSQQLKNNSVTPKKSWWNFGA